MDKHAGRQARAERNRRATEGKTGAKVKAIHGAALPLGRPCLAAAEAAVLAEVRFRPVPHAVALSRLVGVDQLDALDWSEGQAGGETARCAAAAVVLQRKLRAQWQERLD